MCPASKILDKPGMRELARAVSLFLVEVDARDEKVFYELQQIIELVAQEVRQQLHWQAEQIRQQKEEIDELKKDRDMLRCVVVGMGKALKGEADVGEKDRTAGAEEGRDAASVGNNSGNTGEDGRHDA